MLEVPQSSHLSNHHQIANWYTNLGRAPVAGRKTKKGAARIGLEIIMQPLRHVKISVTNSKIVTEIKKTSRLRGSNQYVISQVLSDQVASYPAPKQKALHLENVERHNLKILANKTIENIFREEITIMLISGGYV